MKPDVSVHACAMPSVRKVVHTISTWTCIAAKISAGSGVRLPENTVADRYHRTADLRKEARSRSLGEQELGKSMPRRFEIRKRWGVRQVCSFFDADASPKNVMYRSVNSTGYGSEIPARSCKYKVCLSGLFARRCPEISLRTVRRMPQARCIARALCARTRKLLFSINPTVRLDPIGAAAFDNLPRNASRLWG